MTYDVKAMSSANLYVGRYFSEDMYTRLFLHKIFPDLDKIVYTDVDIILNCDIADLYNTELGNHPIGAIPHRLIQDGDINRLKTATWVKSSTEMFRKYENMYNYLIDYINLSENELKSWFTSGTLLFDLKKTGKIIDEGLPALLGREYLMPDMDILNILFKNNTFPLDKGYCIFPIDLLNYINETGHLPYIIHYAGIAKPHQTMSRLADTEYWKALSHTDLYYPALEGFINHKISLAIHKSYFDNLGRLYIDLKRINRIKRRQRLIRAMLKPLLSAKKYKKLKDRPESFFNDSKSGFIRFVKKYYF